MCPCIYKCVSYYEIFALLAFSSSWQETNHSKSNLKSLILLWLKRSKNISQDSQAEGEKVSIFLKRPWELAFPQIFRYNRDFPEIFFFFPQQTLWAEITLYLLAISPFEMFSFSSESLHRKYYLFILMLLNIYLICTDSSEWANSCSPNAVYLKVRSQNGGHKKT